jgi:hypothetical protein
MKPSAAILLLAGLVLAPVLAFADEIESSFEVHNDTSQDLHIVVDGTYSCDAPGGQHHGYSCKFDSPCSAVLANEHCVLVNLGGSEHTLTVTAGSQTVTKSITLKYEPAEDDPDLGPMDATYLGSCNVNFFGPNLDVYCGE